MSGRHSALLFDIVYKCCPHWLTVEPVSVTDLDLAVKPHGGHLLQPLEPERVELEHGAAVFGVLKDGHSAVRGAAENRDVLFYLQVRCRTSNWD